MLTDSEIRRSFAKDSSYKLFDSGGLFLLIRSTGHRGWRFKYRVSGHEKLLSFGPYPTVSLAKARLKLRRAKALLLDGIDPSPLTLPFLNVQLDLLRISNSYPGDQARQRRADSCCASSEPRFAASALLASSLCFFSFSRSPSVCASGSAPATRCTRLSFGWTKLI
jgi:hypothetical protein